MFYSNTWAQIWSYQWVCLISIFTYVIFRLPSLLILQYRPELQTTNTEYRLFWVVVVVVVVLEEEVCKSEFKPRNSKIGRTNNLSVLSSFRICWPMNYRDIPFFNASSNSKHPVSRSGILYLSPTTKDRCSIRSEHVRNFRRARE